MILCGDHYYLTILARLPKVSIKSALSVLLLSCYVLLYMLFSAINLLQRDVYYTKLHIYGGLCEPIAFGFVASKK